MILNWIYGVGFVVFVLAGTCYCQRLQIYGDGRDRCAIQLYHPASCSDDMADVDPDNYSREFYTGCKSLGRKPEKEEGSK